MPQAMSYKGSSVIYFRGDASKKIYILQSGRVILKREDIETGQEVQEIIQVGEFFGVKSALGKYPREEDAIVVSDSQVLTFTAPEFEELVSKNPRIGIKMLKVFSTQLRKIHSKVRSLMALDEQRSPEDGLFHSAEFYLKKKRYPEAIYILRRYIKYYPTTSTAAKAKQYLTLAEQYSQKYGSGNGPAIIDERASSPGPTRGPVARKQVEETPEEKQLYAALSSMSQGDFKTAMDVLQTLQSSSKDQEIVRRTSFELGRCIYGLKQFEPAIKHFGNFIKQYPEASEMGDVLFVVGQSYEKLGDKAKAGSVYQRILQIPNLEDDIKRKVKQAVSALGS